MHTLICVTFSLPPGVEGWLRLLLVALPGLFCLPFCYRNIVWGSFLTDFPRACVPLQVLGQLVGLMWSRHHALVTWDLRVIPGPWEAPRKEPIRDPPGPCTIILKAERRPYKHAQLSATGYTAPYGSKQSLNDCAGPHSCAITHGSLGLWTLQGP